MNILWLTLRIDDTGHRVALISLVDNLLLERLKQPHYSKLLDLNLHTGEMTLYVHRS